MAFTHQTPLQLPQSLHRLGIIAWDLPHVIVFQCHHCFQHETHLRTGFHKSEMLLNLVEKS